MAAVEISAGAHLGDGGRYRLQGLLGTGGMASVWLAADSRLEREVAIKVLADVLALDQDYVARFEREARLAAALSHPHLVSIYDFSVHGARPYLVLEYIAGGTLADRLRTSQKPRWDPVVLARELLDAIRYIHRAGVIHRDIKPANVLIGIDGRVRLTDFGIAQPSGATRITSTGQVIGTQRYIAPEILSGQPANARSDLYALGVLLGECLRPATSSQLRRLVEMLTKQDPQRRPASAEEALAILQEPATAKTRVRLRPVGPTRTRALPRRTLVTPPRVTRNGRQLQVHLTQTNAAAIAAIAVLVLALILLATRGAATSAPSATKLVAPPSSAPLSRQLDQLARTINQSRR
ncbi:MAG: serine/threonine-protein kinase [Solirubrobacteraceae bacterium]